MKNVNILKDLKTLNKLHTSSVESYTTNNGIVDFACDNAGYVDNVVIEGKTLVNLIRTNLSVEVWDNNRVAINLQDCNYLEGTYTLFNFNDKTIVLDIGEATTNKWLRTFALEKNKVKTFNINNGERIFNVNGLLTDGWENNDTSKNEFRNSIVLLEGDHTDKPISYFEGLKSVGQGDNIEVLSYERGSENLVSNLTFTEGKYVVSITGEIGNNVGFKYSNEYIEVEGGCEYLFDNINGQFAIYDSSKNVIPFRWQDLQDEWFKGNDYQATFVYAMPKNAKYIRINLPISNLKPYSLIKTKSDKKQISTTLRSLSNGVKDTIEKRGNKYVKVQRCGEVVLDGNVDVPNIYKPNSSLNYHRFLVSVEKTPNFGAVCCDRLGSVVDYEIEKDNILADKTYSGFFVTLHNDKTSGTREGFKTWLQANPITVVYELATPQIIELPNFNLQTYKGDNTLLINSGVIQCDASFDVCEGIRSELDVIKDKVSSLDCDYVEDIELQFLNGWSKNTSGYYSAKMVNGVAYINLLCSGGIGTAGTSICYIKDQKFIPKTNIPIIIGTNVGLYVNAFIQVTGKIVIDHIDIPPNSWISICVSYPIL